MYGATAQEERLLGEEGGEDTGEVPEAEHKNNLGVLNGVFVPCLLNILGVILFLRIGWAVGHAGWFGVAMMFVVGETLALLTVFSMAALVSNGNMRGGGSYFLISRSLGAEFGGAIGLLFYSAYSVGTSFYVVGFATEIVEAFIADDTTSEKEKQQSTVIVASLALAVVMVISLLGAGFFTRINGIVFAVQFGSIGIGILSMFLAAPIDELENGGSFEGFSMATLRNNTFGDYTYDTRCGDEVCSVRSVFGILFPAMTGIMEGANLSGDLRNPNRDIGRGTIAAVFAAIATYAMLIVSFAGGFPRATLKHNMNVMANVSWPNKYVIIVGISVSAFSSALGSVFGGSRVLQALGRDDLPPGFGLSFFAKGSAKGDEPRRAVMFTWFIAQCACLIGDLDVISPIITSFFLLSYGTVNLTCLLLDLSGTPNFRPHFRFYSRLQAFMGFSMCLVALFFLDVWYGVVSCTFLIVLFVYISYRAPPKTWGDVSQSIMYHQVRKYLLRLDVEAHSKNWRPSLLLLVGPGRLNMRVIDFCNSLKKGGLYSIGDAVLGDVDSVGRAVEERRSSWLALVKDTGLKAIPEVTFAPTLRGAYQQLVLLAGLGGMKPNCVAVLFPTMFGEKPAETPAMRERRHNLEFRQDSGVRAASSERGEGVGEAEAFPEVPMFERETDFVDVLRDVVFVFQRNLLLACNFDQPFHSRKDADYVDVWIVGEELSLDGSLSLQLQLAHILMLERRERQLRLMNVVDQFCDIEEQKARLQDLAAQGRMHRATFHVIASADMKPLDVLVADSMRPQLEELNRIIASNSQNRTYVSFLGMADLPAADLGADADQEFVQDMQTVLKGLPPLVLVRTGRSENLISADL